MIQTKTKLFISFAVCVVVSVLMCNCSNKENADSNNNGQLTTFTGGIVTEAPIERMRLSSPEISTEVPGFLTRTSMNRDTIGGHGAFPWEPRDTIHVENDNGKSYRGRNTTNDIVAHTTFLVDGSYTTKGQYDVYYCGTSSGVGKMRVAIASNQTQVAFNNTKHFGATGSCGVAKTIRTTVTGKSGYRFDLEHKAPYLCFLPYMTPQWNRTNLKLESIEITSDNNISGTYNLTQTGLSDTGNSKTITLNVGRDGLKLADQATATKSIKNSLYVVITPDTHVLKVKYTVLDAKNTVMTITRSYKSHNFDTNKICDIPINLGVRHHSGHNCYMWDAHENYRFGHEWDSADSWQPAAEDASNDDYPESKTADASCWYYEDDGSFETPINPLFMELPNANEIGWCVLKGDIRWDNSTQWEAFGKTYTGGIWLKKLSVIAQENGKGSATLKLKGPEGNDLRASSDFYGISPANGKSSDGEIDKYSFPPALGYCDGGLLSTLGSGGHCRSSSVNPSSNSNAYYLSFGSGRVHLYSDSYRSYGFVTQPFE